MKPLVVLDSMCNHPNADCVNFIARAHGSGDPPLLFLCLSLLDAVPFAAAPVCWLFACAAGAGLREYSRSTRREAGRPGRRGHGPTGHGHGETPDIVPLESDWQLHWSLSLNGMRPWTKQRMECQAATHSLTRTAAALLQGSHRWAKYSPNTQLEHLSSLYVGLTITSRHVCPVVATYCNHVREREYS